MLRWAIISAVELNHHQIQIAQLILLQIDSSIMLSILLLLSPLPFAVAIPRPQSGDFESDLRSFPPDDSNNVAIPDQPAKFFSDEGVGVPSFSTNSWPVATEDNAFFNLDDPNSLDYSLVPSTSNLDEWGVPFFALQSKEYCKTIQEAAFCSSGSPTERFALPGEIDVTLLNAEQSMFVLASSSARSQNSSFPRNRKIKELMNNTLSKVLDSFVLPYYTCDAPRAVYCCTTSFPREPIIVHSPSGIDRVSSFRISIPETEQTRLFISSLLASVIPNLVIYSTTTRQMPKAVISPAPRRTSYS